jgi:hypothetical protein
MVIRDDTLYVAGDFPFAGSVAGTSRIAAWSIPSNSWSGLGGGVNNSVYALAIRDDTLYVGGEFTQAGDDSLSKIAAWSEVDDTWSSLGAGLNARVASLAWGDDSLYATGNFTNAGGNASGDYVATWSSIDDTWRALGTGLGNVGRSLTWHDDTLYVGGFFDLASSVPGTRRIAAWSFADETWHALGQGIVDQFVEATALHDDTLYAGGSFTGAVGVNDTTGIAAWSHADDTWHPVGGGVSGGGVLALAVDDTFGLIYAGGTFTSAGDDSAANIAAWDAEIQEWIPLQTNAAGSNGTLGSVSALLTDDSVVYVGGSFESVAGPAGATAANRVAKWTWQEPQGSNSLIGQPGDVVTITGEGFIGVPRSGAVEIDGNVVAYTRDDSAHIRATVPAGTFASAPITVRGVGGTGNVGTFTSANPSPPPPAPSDPPSAPRDVSAVAGTSSATVTWTAPASSGSFPITNYKVTSSPGGQTCLIAAPALTCTVDGLTNRTSYTFTVEALNGAGWSVKSAPSNPVTPQPDVTPTILITGYRGTGDATGRVYADGTTTHLAGTTVQTRVRVAGQPEYADGSTRAVSADGTFTWQRRTNKKTYLYFTTEGISSNRIIIQAR